jgi:trk system potassium uptake protein TrkH
MLRQDKMDEQDFLTIVYTLSNMLRFVGAAMIAPVLVSAFYSEWFFAEVFALLGFVVFIVFTFTKEFLGPRNAKMKHAVISIAFAWFLISVISAIPFLFAGISFVDAFFESVSGWTGTGLSMVVAPEKLPFALNFWRGFIQWMGGFGIVLMALLFYERPETAVNLFQAEGRSEEFYVNVKRVARTILTIYFIYTLLGTALFLFSGLSLFDSVVHSFTSIATGGFSTASVGVGFFGFSAMITCILLMLLGGISFESHYDLLRGKVRKFFSGVELRFFLGVIVFAVILISFSLFFSGSSNYFDGFFYAVSAITGTGATGYFNLAEFPALAVFVLILLMVFGACYGSTTGALKIWRILILFNVVRREIYKVFLPPGSIVPIRLGGKVVSDDVALKALTYLSLYVFILAFGSIVFMLFGFGVVDSVFSVASAQGNVGLSTVFGSAWFEMNPFLKLLLSLHMIVGRMEIFPFLILLKSMGFGKAI